MISAKQAKKLIGRTIISVDLQEQWISEGWSREKAQSPIIRLDDGTFLEFTALEEPDGGDPFVILHLVKAK